jgi:dihydrofolate reductase
MISRRPDLVIPGVTVVSSIADAINCANSMEVFIAGGAEIYREALPLVQRILLTEIQADFAGDTFFPVLGPSDWRETACENHKDGASGLAYHFVTLERRD